MSLTSCQVFLEMAKATYKSFKIHTDENQIKTDAVKVLLSECRYVANYLLHIHSGSFIEQSSYDFTFNTKSYNDYFNLRSHHYQQIQAQVHTILWNRYKEIASGIKFPSRYITYIARFFGNFDGLEAVLRKKIKDTKDDTAFYQKVLDLWTSQRESIEILIKESILDVLRYSRKKPFIKSLCLSVDVRSSKIQTSTNSKHFEYWLEIRTNKKISTREYEVIYIHLKWSNKYHGSKVNSINDLEPGFKIRWDSIYDRLELITSYKVAYPTQNKNYSRDVTIAIDLGYSYLFSADDGSQIELSPKLKKEITAFRKYEARVKKEMSAGRYNSNKYLKEEQKITNKVNNEIRFQFKKFLSDHPWVLHYIFEILTIADQDSGRGRDFNYKLRRFKLQGSIEIIERLLRDRGLSLAQVSSYYTSRECPVCSSFAKENRKDDKYLCKSCGYEGKADVVAAVNIKERFFSADMKAVESLWNEDLKKSKISGVLKERHEAWKGAISTSSPGSYRELTH